MKKKFVRNLAPVLALCLLAIPLFSLSAQTAKPVVYELGESMITLMLKQSAYYGASPAELAGMRAGIEQRLAETPIVVTLRNNGNMLMEMKGETQEFTYTRSGLKLMMKNLQTGEFIQFGFFSKDESTLTLINGTILDRRP